MTYSQREIVAALEQWSAGNLTLTAEQQQGVTAALVELVRVLDAAPSGADRIASGVWFLHERRPALARLSDALHPQDEGVALQEHRERLQTDQEVIEALKVALARGR
jgi:hypothetical protein